jgi:hypothetical protein
MGKTEKFFIMKLTFLKMANVTIEYMTTQTLEYMGIYWFFPNFDVIKSSLYDIMIFESITNKVNLYFCFKASITHELLVIHIRRFRSAWRQHIKLNLNNWFVNTCTICQFICDGSKHLYM